MCNFEADAEFHQAELRPLSYSTKLEEQSIPGTTLETSVINVTKKTTQAKRLKSPQCFKTFPTALPKFYPNGSFRIFTKGLLTSNISILV